MVVRPLPLVETLFCRSLDLVEQTSPTIVLHLYQLLIGSMNILATPTGRSSRACQRLTVALQRQLISGNRAAIDLALAQCMAGIAAPQDSAAYWRAQWARHYLLPYLPGTTTA